MLNRPTELSQTDAQSQNITKVTQKQKSQHGIHDIRRPILIDVPAEVLTGITSSLNPPSLLALAQVNKYLNEHVKDDNTWRRAFVYQILGVAPEGDLNDEKTLLLRRTERSWRAEFHVRYRLRRRWERSRNVTTAHIPVHSRISGMHMMPQHSLLTSSIQYGIVARSLPLTGKILSGYLDASGTRAGLGIGNPNAEFTPNVSACAMTSDGGTAKIVWGSRVGDVLFINAPRAMETTRRSAADVNRCQVVDEHDGAVLDAKWVEGLVVTGGADGRVKLWDPKAVSCTWTSQPVLKALVPDACVKVAASILRGIIVGVFKSGDVHVWTGFDLTQPIVDILETAVPNPIKTSTEGYDADAAHEVTSLHIDTSHSSPVILVAYQNDPHFYRIQITQQIDITAFGDPNFGPTSVVVPYFRSENNCEHSIVFVGDHIGCISVYAFDTSQQLLDPRMNTVRPARKFEAHSDGADVTALAWNGLTLITGSVRGTTHIFDGMTFEVLRSFPSPVPRLRGVAAVTSIAEEGQMVKHILVSPDKEVMFVGVGDRVMAWRAGPVPKNSPGGVRGRHTPGAFNKKKKSGTAKYLEQLEMKETISESRSLSTDESKSVQRAYGREREQRTRLDTLGLSEVEAVEYVLMLSRDEATTRVGSGSGRLSPDIDEGVFEGDFDEDDPDFDDGRTTTASRRPSSSTNSSSSSVGFGTAPRISSSASSGSGSSASTASGRSSVTNRNIGGRPIPRVGPSASNEKVQISPPFRMEPMEAGQEYPSGSPTTGTRMHIEDHFFPPISPAGSSGVSSIPGTAASAGVSPKVRGKGKKKTSAATSPGSTPSGSPKSIRSSTSASGSPSAWTIPLTKKASGSMASPSSPVARANAWAQGPGLSRISPPTPLRGSVLGASLHRQVGSPPRNSLPVPSGPPVAAAADVEAEMDDDLRFAIELSLVEARSRGEGV